MTSDDHPWRGRSLIPTAELRGQPVLIGHASSLTRRLLEPALREGGFGLDITLADDLAADDSTSGPALVDEYSPMSAPFWIYWSRERALAPAVQAFVRHVQEAGRNTHRVAGESRSS